MRLFNNKKKTGNKKYRGVVFFLTLSICAVILFLVFNMKAGSVETKEEVQVNRIVSVQSIQPKAYASRIKLMGEVVSEWQTDICSQVSGKVTKVSSNFRFGGVLKKGEVLLETENTAYIAQQAEAEVRLANARINLLREEKAAEDAQLNWKRSGLSGAPSSPLVLRKPQLEAAKNELKAATANLKNADLQLSYTKLTAPFNGIVASRNVDLGEVLAPGTKVASMYSTDKAVITVYVNKSQWNLIAGDLHKIKARLIESETGNSWKAKLARDGKQFDKTTRLKPLVLEVKDPLKQENPLLTGNFLKVELKGNKIPGLIRVNESALTKGGYIWYVDTENKLRNLQVKPLFFLDGEMYFNMPTDITTPIRIAINPNSTFISGFKVEPKLVEGGV